MDDWVRPFLWTLAGGGFFALLGGAFGALTGALAWASGRAGGTALGLAVARAFDRAAGGELSRVGKGALAGAADGLVFLGVAGTLLGFVCARSGRGAWDSLVPAMLAGLRLAGGAVCFGGLAYFLVLFSGGPHRRP
jgi:hypothetical protein